MGVGDLVRTREDWPWDDFFLYAYPDHGGSPGAQVGIMTKVDMGVVLEVRGSKYGPWVRIYTVSGLCGWTRGDKLDVVNES